MMLPSFCHDTITVSRAPLIEERGSHIPDWTHAETHTIGHCSVQPAGSSLSLGDPRVLNTQILQTAYLPPDADIQAGDRITWQGVDYVIDGEPAHWTSPTGILDHIVISLIAWKG
ncbi:hypothetical protein [Bifidobacterium simiiventris]|uniref:hypothetical protein n=1 Tax=Bifidobacterium simiiventris TaxID=2834434 RepID=UPI001C56879D|nr:hypothetical protein [Bifidobacterium simiiventris]MBW3077692.1 hypothetical protein [Bifidobacterium simiiventris]